jgi:hypothetical protein
MQNQAGWRNYRCHRTRHHCWPGLGRRLAYCFFRRRRKETVLPEANVQKNPDDDDHSAPVVEANIANVYSLQHEISEVSGDRRISELDTSSGVYPPPLPRAHIRSPSGVVTSPHDDDWRRAMGPVDVGPSTHAPCNKLCTH